MPTQKKYKRLAYLLTSGGFICIVFVLSGYLFIAKSATNIDKARDDYNFQYTKYRDSQEKFTNAKTSYFSFKTATSKDQAFQASKDYLTQVINLNLAYFALVREYSSVIDWQDGDAYKKVIQNLEDNNNLYLQTQQSINTALTLEDLSRIASDLKTDQQDKIDPKTYEILAIYEINKAKELLAEFDTIAFKLSANKQNFTKSSVLSNWQSEIATIKKNATDKLNKTQETYKGTSSNRFSEGDLNNIANGTAQTKAELKLATALFKEAVKLF